jgi:hypothetical protein
LPFLFLPFGEVRQGRLYSYGDSSGIEPDSHFNSFNSETNYDANVKAIILKFKN